MFLTSFKTVGAAENHESCRATVGAAVNAESSNRAPVGAAVNTEFSGVVGTS